MNAKIFVKIFTWLKEKILQKEKSTYNFETKTDDSNIVININIGEFHFHNSFSTQEDVRSKYNKNINKK
jgi:hypothetical protein